MSETIKPNPETGITLTPEQQAVVVAYIHSIQAGDDAAAQAAVRALIVRDPVVGTILPETIAIIRELMVATGESNTFQPDALAHVGGEDLAQLGQLGRDAYFRRVAELRMEFGPDYPLDLTEGEKQINFALAHEIALRLKDISEQGDFSPKDVALVEALGAEDSAEFLQELFATYPNARDYWRQIVS